MTSKPILCMDFDGCINSYTSGWKGANIIPDRPVTGAILWLFRATNWWNVQIYSSRSSQEGGINAMQKWLALYALLELGEDDATQFMDSITFPTQKPAAFLTIDDRAICFDGEWSKLDPVDLLNFKPWNKK